ncbi:adenylylsulfate kinase [Stanieria cyanosphaera PCC 7437]|uniref:gluconokinase n=1 Tax=Stanieria cyanosphaera (strain ATCC 29371 / PCC 7437) TaxID=111780 RepID=K9XX28_STAC7|nr:AAA family ATPase [Stanieria cyanosphaera]AFZ36609.1 adenylylsulfate kinase [Stanieria cyanosphaera PCC 7437]
MNQINIAALIDQMQQPSFYPHAVTESIELVQTHVSYILLTGDYAYKLKKAVNFGFLDYSTLAKRKHFLEEEISMNRVIAPELYLEVVPITKTGDNFSLGGEGEAVEYALKMRQFPQENLFINLFEAGKLSIEQMEELGKIVAQFHAQAATNDYISSFGTVAKVREAFDENYQQTEQYVGRVQTQSQLAETQAFTDSFFAEREDLFQARIAEHKIKECHGDLHLKNICLWQDKIQLFDRIEFNEPFRFVDVMYDVAFAVMDLDARGRKDFGNAFLNTYLEQTGDWEGLQLLPLYLSRQAYVRAKVTSFLLDDPAIDDKVKQEASQIAADYYKQAWEYTQPTQGKLILMSGLSGSGKSTVAKAIARKTGAIQIRSDAVRKHLAGIALDDKGSDEIYSSEMSQKTYDRLLELGIMLAKAGFTVILDAKYDRISSREPVIAAAKTNQIPLQIINCTAPLEVLSDRLSSRSGDISDATADLLASQQATAEDFTEAEQVYVTTVDTSKKDWEESLNI